MYFKGTRGNDLFSPTAGDDVIQGGRGDDWVHGSTGNDVEIGGLGNDTMGGGEGNDRIQGGAGNDAIYAEWGDDLIIGGNGDDELWGGPGRDTIIGGKGHDYVRGSGALYGDEIGAQRVVGYDWLVTDGTEARDVATTHTGGKGFDIFMMLADGADGVGSRVTVLDFNPAEGDRFAFWADMSTFPVTDQMFVRLDTNGDRLLNAADGGDVVQGAEGIELHYSGDVMAFRGFTELSADWLVQ